MTAKITGYEHQPVPIDTTLKVSRTEATATSAPSTAPAANPVQITDSARQLAALEPTLQGAVPVNEARVNAIRLAIEAGRYEINAQAIADKLLRMEQDLSG